MERNHDRFGAPETRSAGAPARATARHQRGVRVVARRTGPRAARIRQTVPDRHDRYWNTWAISARATDAGQCLDEADSCGALLGARRTAPPRNESATRGD